MRITRRVVRAGLFLSFAAWGAGCNRPTAISSPNVSAPVVEVKASNTEWKAWRGPRGDGTSPDDGALIEWGPKKNVKWVADVPGRGLSSPIVVGRIVVVTTADESRGEQSVLAFDRDTGRSVWERRVHQGTLPRKHSKNSHASATPVSNGRQIYVAFVVDNALWVTSLDLNGEQIWQTRVADFTSEHGYGSSPVLDDGLLIVNGDSLKDGFLAALDTATGDVAWKIPRPTTGRHGSYSTPVVATVAGRRQLLLAGGGITASYDPQTGKILWTVQGPAEVTANTMAFGETMVFSSGGYPQKELLAIRADGSGDVTDTHIAWRTAKGVTYVPSPLYHAGRLFVVSDEGVATCFDASSGQRLWQERLNGKFTASPVLAGEWIYATNEDGRTYVFKAGSKFELAAVNDLEDGGFASPVICGGCIYLRTNHKLFCVGRSEES